MRIFDIKKMITNSICFITVVIGIIICSHILFYDFSETFVSNIDNSYEESSVNFAVYIENDSGEYEEYSNTISSFSTTLSNMQYNEEMSGCTDIDDNELIGVLTYSNGVVYVDTGVTTYCTLYFDQTSINFYDYLIATASSNGGTDGTLIEHSEGCDDGCAEDGHYRYSGSSYEVNNYVCFGTSDVDECFNDTDTYLFRIIEINPDDGAVKIIKATALAGDDSYSSYSGEGDLYYWNSTDGTQSTAIAYGSYYNYWAVNSTLYSTLAYDLNNIYLYTFNNDWQDLILEYDWNIGGNDTTYFGYPYNIWSSTQFSKGYYDEESAVKGTFKIGLMNAYDYGYATYSVFWDVTLYYYYTNTYGTTSGTNVINENGAAGDYDWLQLGVNEWTISRVLGSSGYAFISNNNISFYYGYINVSIRPSFYLTNEVYYESGTGVEDDPYIISY